MEWMISLRVSNGVIIKAKIESAMWSDFIVGVSHLAVDIKYKIAALSPTISLP